MWWHTELDKGSEIVGYLETVLPSCSKNTSLIVELTAGVQVVDGEVTSDRFAEIHISPHELTLRILTKWFTAQKTYARATRMPGESFDKVVQAHALINLTQLYNRVRHEAASA
jgi:hypothetical protein